MQCYRHVKQLTALENFVQNLHDHVLDRLRLPQVTGNTSRIEARPPYTDRDRAKVTIVNNRIYRHKVLRINYTTYDMQRAQDSLNPRTQADVIVLADEESASQAGDPYWYARVLGVFHADVRYQSSPGVSSVLTRVDFLWIRWFERDTNYTSGLAVKRLPCLRFFNETLDPAAFGFLNPADIVRGAHVLPAFARGERVALPPSLARPTQSTKEWNYYYVNM